MASDIGNVSHPQVQVEGQPEWAVEKAATAPPLGLSSQGQIPAQDNIKHEKDKVYKINT